MFVKLVPERRRIAAPSSGSSTRVTKAPTIGSAARLAGRKARSRRRRRSAWSGARCRQFDDEQDDTGGYPSWAPYVRMRRFGHKAPTKSSRCRPIWAKTKLLKRSDRRLRTELHAVNVPGRGSANWKDQGQDRQRQQDSQERAAPCCLISVVVPPAADGRVPTMPHASSPSRTWIGALNSGLFCYVALSTRRRKSIQVMRLSERACHTSFAEPRDLLRRHARTARHVGNTRMITSAEQDMIGSLPHVQSVFGARWSAWASAIEPSETDSRAVSFHLRRCAGGSPPELKTPIAVIDVRVARCYKIRRRAASPRRRKIESSSSTRE